MINMNFKFMSVTLRSFMKLFTNGISQFSTVNSAAHLCRSFMYVPGDKMNMIQKVIHTDNPPDIVVLDCEDGVGFANKDVARKNIASVIESGEIKNCHRSTVCIRLNSISNDIVFKSDLQLLSQLLKSSQYVYPHMVNLPKVENEKDVILLNEELKKSIDCSKLMQPLRLSLMIESCRSVVKLQELLEYVTTNKFECFQIENCVFGSDDYCASLGVSRSKSNVEVLYSRQHFATVCKAFGVSPIDMVDIDLNDLTSLELNCKFGASIGFLGKQVIHPKQLDIVHSVFSPDNKRIEHARELLNEYEKVKKQGTGVFVFRNQMIDMPTILQAQNLVNINDAINKK